MDNKIITENMFQRKRKKTKSKRRFFYIFVFFLILFILPPIAISIPFVQTFVVKKVSGLLSEHLQTEVKVKSVNIRLFNKVLINGIYLEDDIFNDTLLYVNKLEANIGKLPIGDRTFTLNKIKLSDGIFCLRSDSTGINISNILKRLSKQDTTDSVESQTKMMAKSLELHNFRYKMYLNNGATTEEQPEGIIYKNMSVSDINLDADRISIKNDTLHFRVNSLSFNERSGLNIQKIAADSGYICFGKEVTLKEFRMIDDFSDIKMKSLSMIYDGGEEFRDFVNKVNFILDVYDSQVSFATVGFFAPALANVSATAELNACITGPVANFRSDSFEIKSLDNTYIQGRFSIMGLPDVENTILFADLKQLYSCSSDISTVLSEISNGQFNDGGKLKKFGNINFKGTFTGFVRDFVAHGYLLSNLGALNMDILLKSNANGFGFKGNLEAINFNIGKLADSHLIGNADFNFMVDGKIQKGGKNDISGHGIISSLYFNDYKYQNVNIKGNLINQSFSGEVTVSEPNLDLDFNGNINLAGGEDRIPVFEFDADLRHVDLVKLHFNKKDTVSILKTKINANFKSASILDYSGKLNINNLLYNNNGTEIYLGDIVLSNRDKTNYLELQSDFIDAVYYGPNDLSGFINQLKYTAQKYIPDLFPLQSETSSVNHLESEYCLRAQIKEVKGITQIFAPGLYIENGSELDLVIDTASRLDLRLVSDKIVYEKNRISKVKLLCNNISDTLDLSLFGDLSVSGLTLYNFQVKNLVSNNIIATDISFLDSKNNSRANISTTSHFSKEAESGKLSSIINLNKSFMTFFGQKWELESANVKLNDNSLNIQGFNFHQNGQQIKISGIVSKSDTDSLFVTVDNYMLSGLNPYIESNGYSLYGVVSGGFEIVGLYGTPVIIGGIETNDLVINGDTLGNAVIGSMWNDNKQRLDITARIYDSKKVNTSINGYYVPSTDEITANCKIIDLRLNSIEPFLQKILSDISGSAQGNIDLSGTLKNPRLSGLLTLKDVGLTVNYIKTHYVVNSDINISNSRMNISNGQIKDVAGNTGILNMDLTHNYFTNIEFDAKANITNFMSLNTKEKDNPLFYGAAYASGVVGLSGTADHLNLSVTAATGANSILYIPLSSTSQAKEFEFLTFVNSLPDSGNAAPPVSANTNTQTNIDIGFDLTVTPESEIQILIDPKVGDILKTKGNGNLKINVNPSIDHFSILGDYVIESGDYNFTLPNFSILSRKFLIDKGSSVHFNGDATDATLNVSASYKERVSLSALFPEDSLRNYPVLCQILITGRMTNPKLKFNIEIQDVDPEKKAQFLSLVNTEEKMTKQFLSILVLRTFLPEQSLANQDLGSSALLSNASDLLSSQISSLISLFKLPVPLDVNVGYNANARNSSGSEFEVDFSTQLFNRVIINGSASNATHSNRGFVGDFEAEVLLGKYGHTRFKVFSKSRDYFSDDMDNNRNGIGISYQSQFNRFIDILRRKKKNNSTESTK